MHFNIGVHCFELPHKDTRPAPGPHLLKLSSGHHPSPPKEVTITRILYKLLTSGSFPIKSNIYSLSNSTTSLKTHSFASSLFVYVLFGFDRFDMFLHSSAVVESLQQAGLFL